MLPGNPANSSRKRKRPPEEQTEPEKQPRGTDTETLKGGGQQAPVWVQKGGTWWSKDGKGGMPWNKDGKGGGGKPKGGKDAL